MIDVFYEGDTARIRLPQLIHDEDGIVVDNATVTYQITDDDGDVVGYGDLEWTPQLGWSALFQVPALDSNARLVTVVTAVYSGSTKQFREVVPIRNLSLVP
jgi:hypothetical protein